MPRPLIATIDIAALRSNLALAKARAPHSKAWAVVKANAYGHGLERGMRGFAAADGLGLIELDAAARLRELGWNKRILLLEGFFDASDTKLLAEHRLDTVIHCEEQLLMLEQAKLRTQIDVHLKLNSGMNRLGFTPARYRAAYERLRAIPAVRHISFVTHFANAEDPDNPVLPVQEQVRRFKEATRDLPGEKSLANSATDLLHPAAAADWIRPGIMLYGATPGAQSAEQFGLRAAMSLHSEIIGVQHIVAGDAVGYGSAFVATAPMTIGVVACGYADGYPRHAPSGTPVIVDGVKTRMVGRVSMDMITVDLTPVAKPRIGSKVTLWGASLPIDEVANAAGTVGYELMCGLAPRVQIVEVN
ncbi:alanine racemase [Janthinobacterium sp. Marseille]|uniref:Alanine racemase n=1 Tax=Janthinobacterium sp. (strain Marseille) TaxID=375286 RepID=ALR_JANMA|nr:alanine racemase [Janthinobacterium sp. Marseille]A6SY68.1 RecName: Full=Alanine racemase [Janthinobacterium sp. Marseille]ABR88832.1 alanine racemase [Janthinobacterium sp. Marseille]